MLTKLLVGTGVTMALGTALHANAQGVWTQCWGISGGINWVITDGSFSFEVCKARVIDCTGNPNATVKYESRPVVIPTPLKTCTSRLPMGAEPVNKNGPGAAGPAPGRVSGGASSVRPATANNPLVPRTDEAGVDRHWTASFLLPEIKKEIAANNCAQVTQYFSHISSGGFNVYWPAFYRDAVAVPNECAYNLVKGYMSRFNQTFSEADQKNFGTAGMTTNRNPGVPLTNGDAARTQLWIDRMIGDGIDKDRLLLAAAKDCSRFNHRAREAVAYLVRFKGADVEFGAINEPFVESPKTASDLIRANCSDIPLEPPKPIPAGKLPADAAAKRGWCTPELQAMDACGSPSIPPNIKIQPLPPGYVPATPGRTR